jgi:hypothetical protein
MNGSAETGLPLTLTLSPEGEGTPANVHRASRNIDRQSLKPKNHQKPSVEARRLDGPGIGDRIKGWDRWDEWMNG